jgi:rhamnogalacturonyl hydrolase YesR
MSRSKFIRFMRLFVLGFLALFAVETGAQTDSAMLASGIRYGNIMSKFFIRKNTTISTSNTYYNAASWYGILLFDQALKDTMYLDTIQKMYKKLLATNPPLDTGMVDNNAHGILPFELYRETGYAPFLTAGKRLADDEFSPGSSVAPLYPKHLRPDTLSTFSRFWIDDMYMIGSLQTNAFRNNPDSVRYLNNAARTLSRYIDSNQTPNGLFWHSTGNPVAHYFWGRGNGWSAASMAELLQALPTTHPLHAKIMAAYLRQMHGLMHYQDRDGMWHQLLDDSTTQKEASCVCMYTFALATGLRLGWISGDSAATAVKKAWTVITTSYVDSVNGLKNVCPGFGANATRSAYLTVTFTAAGDPHGTAGFIWAANAVTQLYGTLVTGVRAPGNSALNRNIVNAGRADNRIFDIRGRCIGVMENGKTGLMSGRGCYLYKGRLALQLQK